jgi:hypothetical protein
MVARVLLQEMLVEKVMVVMAVMAEMADVAA